MKNKKNVLMVLASLLVIMLATSCATTPFNEKVSLLDNEMLTLDNVTFDGVISLDDLQKLGTIEAKRTITYNLQSNGDYVMEMGDFKYSYTALTAKAEITGTRVIGKLKTANAIIPEVGAAAGLVGSLFAAPTPAVQSAPSVSSLGPKSVAIDAVNYDLMILAAAKGGSSLLLPEYSWELEEEQTGTKTAALLFIPGTKIYETKVLKYTVTARATVVSF